jgi:2-dehydro-3-deoxy-D-arabinonate dehydratase
MRLGQIRWRNRFTAAIFDGKGARPLPDYTIYDLICRSERDDVPLTAVAERLATAHIERENPVIPVQPREVWACGCTYETSAAFRDGEVGTPEGYYAAVYKGDRPEIFFKGTARICVGPGQPIGIRSDSKFTAPEPELAVVLGSQGRILGYTLANDVSAWDIERQNPLYLPQSKIYTGSCSLGPVIVTPDEIPDPRALDMTCTITRNDKTIFSGTVSTSRLGRKIETLIEFLQRSNPTPAGTVLLTGTGIIVNESAALKPGDTVTIEIPQIGQLVNPAALV